MVVISASVDAVDAYLVASTAVVATTLYYLRKQNQQSTREAPRRYHLTLLVLVHTLYIIYALLLCWPPNIFQRLQIPLNASSETIRRILLRHAGVDANNTLPKPLETLLTRLSSFETRTFYVRFGQTVVQDCEHCKTFDEYALFALPRACLQYIRTAAVLGLLTVSGSGRERWRTYVVGGLVSAAVMEGYWISTTAIQLPPDGMNVFMLHDNLWALRQLLFLFLPIITHFLPPASPCSDPVVLATAVRHALEKTMTRLSSLRYARGAVMRDPTLRAAAEEWWERQRLEGEWARSDDGVRRIAERLGRGFAEAGEEGGEGKLRTLAREAVSRMRTSLTTPLD